MCVEGEDLCVHVERRVWGTRCMYVQKGYGGKFRPQLTVWSGECLSVSPQACIILCVHMFVSLRALLDTCTPPSRLSK